MTDIRNHIELHGILQGIGCRPTVHRLAADFNLAGWVINTSDAVTIEIEGPEDSCRLFLDNLQRNIPVPGKIEKISVSSVPTLGEKHFRIKDSSSGNRQTTPIPPDVSICPACLEEMFDHNDRRFLYPFTTCTICGPRFTVVRSFPYDRERTSMSDFKMCPDCQREYGNPSDRRFHSQTNSCSVCGPSLELLSSSGHYIAGDPISNTISLLKEGKVVAMKGIGGFHLACDALNEEAVNLLRVRKGRAEKPFAVMFADSEEVVKYCAVSSVEKLALESMASPIVLLKSRGMKLADAIAPGMGTIGVMLPYSPLHHLLFRRPGLSRNELPSALVMTSGNRSEEPICKDNDEAIHRLHDLADAFLLHNREIVLRADDSIVRVIANRPVVFRRSRGFVPGAFELACQDNSKSGHTDEFQKTPNPSFEALLGTGGDLKNAPALLKGTQIVPGPHVGDLASPIAQDYFAKAVSTLENYLEVKSDWMTFDPHPEYFSSQLARRPDMKLHPVYHHHAHAVSLLVENRMDAPTLFAVFDGTGYGPDGMIWGGEFLLADRKSFTRLGRLGLFPLPGSEAAIREPLRILSTILWLADPNEFEERFRHLLEPDFNKALLWIETFKKGINSPLTSSAGRLFDAAAALAGFRRTTTFESQASMWFEGIADPEECGNYDIKIFDKDLIEADSGHLIAQMADDATSGTPAPIMSARFHNSMATIVADTVEIAANRTGIGTVGLTGGCFQNRLLTEKSIEYLTKKGLKTIIHEAVPPNDGGIAIGQVASAYESLSFVTG